MPMEVMLSKLNYYLYKYNLSIKIILILALYLIVFFGKSIGNVSTILTTTEEIGAEAFRYKISLELDLFKAIKAHNQPITGRTLLILCFDTIHKNEFYPLWKSDETMREKIMLLFSKQASASINTPVYNYYVGIISTLCLVNEFSADQFNNYTLLHTDRIYATTKKVLLILESEAKKGKQ
jgi:hypothetical protein